MKKLSLEKSQLYLESSQYLNSVGIPTTMLKAHVNTDLCVLLFTICFGEWLMTGHRSLGSQIEQISQEVLYCQAKQFIFLL